MAPRQSASSAGTELYVSLAEAWTTAERRRSSTPMSATAYVRERSDEYTGPVGGLVPDSPEAVQYAKFADLRAEIAELGDAFGRERSRHERWIAAALDRDGLFLLSQIAETSEGVTFDALTENLLAPNGWMGIAKLLRSGLIDENGRRVYPTQSGLRVWQALHDHL